MPAGQTALKADQLISVVKQQSVSALRPVLLRWAFIICASLTIGLGGPFLWRKLTAPRWKYHEAGGFKDFNFVLGPPGDRQVKVVVSSLTFKRLPSAPEVFLFEYSFEAHRNSMYQIGHVSYYMDVWDYSGDNQVFLGEAVGNIDMDQWEVPIVGQISFESWRADADLNVGIKLPYR